MHAVSDLPFEEFRQSDNNFSHKGRTAYTAWTSIIGGSARWVWRREPKTGSTRLYMAASPPLLDRESSGGAATGCAAMFALPRLATSFLGTISF